MTLELNTERWFAKMTGQEEHRKCKDQTHRRSEYWKLWLFQSWDWKAQELRWAGAGAGGGWWATSVTLGFILHHNGVTESRILSLDPGLDQIPTYKLYYLCILHWLKYSLSKHLLGTCCWHYLSSLKSFFLIILSPSFFSGIYSHYKMSSC